MPPNLALAIKEANSNPRWRIGPGGGAIRSRDFQGIIPDRRTETVSYSNETFPDSRTGRLRRRPAPGPGPAAPGRGECPAGEGVDHQTRVHEPACGPPSESRRRAQPQRRAGLLHRDAKETDPYRRDRKVLS